MEYASSQVWTLTLSHKHTLLPILIAARLQVKAITTVQITDSQTFAWRTLQNGSYYMSVFATTESLSLADLVLYQQANMFAGTLKACRHTKNDLF